MLTTRFRLSARLAVVSLALAGVAHAGPVDPVQAGWHPMGNGGFCGTVGRTHSAPTAGGVKAHIGSKVLFVNRCAGGCTITGATTADSTNDRSAVMGLNPGQVYDIPEFTNFAAQTGTMADEQWGQVVACVTETMSYFDVSVVDQRPASGGYHMAVVGGGDEDIDITSSTGGQLLGISQLDIPNCGPIDNVISFALAKESRLLAGNANNYVRDVCKTIIHEAGHAFGLEHEWKWLDDGSSACADPMSYDTITCDPSPAYFRNRIASCGGDQQYPCQCAGVTNSHLKLTNVFGPGNPTVPPPTLSFITPNSGSLGQAVSVNAGSKRGVAKVELYLNGWKWDQKPGVPFAAGGGQPNPSVYSFSIPARVPNSVYDIEVRAYDDLEVMTSSVVTATRGAPCANADSCLAGQKCEEGKCYWDPPAADFGEECTYDEFCLSNMCAGTADTKICTQTCIPGTADSCPDGLRCIETGGNDGVCFLPDEGGGCCQVNGGSSIPWAPAGISLGVLAVLMRRRRR